MYLELGIEELKNMRSLRLELLGAGRVALRKIQKFQSKLLLIGGGREVG